MGRRRNVLVQGLALSFFIVVVVMLIPSSARTQTTLSKRYGMNGDILTPGDYNGDGITNFAVFRPSNGQWFVDTNRDGVTNLSRQYGTSGDIPVPGDYDGDGLTDFAVFRPSAGRWFIDTNRDGITDINRQYGVNGDIPVPGDYDGDFITDLAVWRPSNGTWYVSGSLDGSGACTTKMVTATEDCCDDDKAVFTVTNPCTGNTLNIRVQTLGTNSGTFFLCSLRLAFVQGGMQFSDSSFNWRDSSTQSSVCDSLVAGITKNTTVTVDSGVPLDLTLPFSVFYEDTKIIDFP